MKNLSEKKYWDSIYDNISSSKKTNPGIKDWLKNISRDYSNFVIWENILPKLLPKKSSLKIIEIGCAPGKYLLNFRKNFGYEPYGVEYSEKGCEITRDNFSKEGVSSSNIIFADFFDNKFQQNNFEKYDIIFSRGFIEHYDDVHSVVKLHADLIKKDGYVVVMIPNLNGLNRVLAKFLNKSSYDLHNLSIMDKKVYSDLFTKNGIEVMFCGYVGIFSVGLFNTDSKLKYLLYRILLILQRPFDLIFRVFLSKMDLGWKYTSPYLLFVGQKR
ncbi:MAG: class I SAM-dependent methyltransferase [Minisyncoccia bacterium]